MTARAFRIVVEFVTVFLLFPFLPGCNAQIIEIREKGGKEITCATSGLQSFGSFCGLDNDFYSYIFLGTIHSVYPIANGEYRIHFHAEEIFRGEPATDIYAVTNQGQCLPDLRPGDQWLTFLEHDPKRGLVLEYGNDSRPRKGNEDELVRLRRLAKMTDAGLLIGDVNLPHWDGDAWDGSGPVANYEITATRKDNHTEHYVFTDKDGHFEFDPLSAGDYVVGSNTAPGVYTADEGDVEVKPHGCMKLNINLSPDGIISGKVSTSDGKPAVLQRIFAMTVDEEDTGWTSETTDEHGAFTFRGVQPGRYLLGIGTQSDTGSSEPNIAVYFPSALSADGAVVITLGDAEHREGLDIVIPPARK